MGIGVDDAGLRWLEGDAAAMPLASGSVDLVLSSFVLQLVPDRAAALRDAMRILRPGGSLAAVTWLEGGPDFAPAMEFDEAVIDLGIPEPEDDEEEERSGDFRSRRAAADELRRVGFERVSARGRPWSTPGRRSHTWPSRSTTTTRSCSSCWQDATPTDCASWRATGCGRCPRTPSRGARPSSRSWHADPPKRLTGRSSGAKDGRLERPAVDAGR